VVTSQDPPAGSVTPKGTAVRLILSTSRGSTPLAISASPTRFVCGAGSIVRLQLRLSEDATVRARLLSGRRMLLSKRLGRLRAGSSTVRVKLPRRLARGSYTLRFDAAGDSRTARTAIALEAGSRRACSVR
jgi:hypothetical protein